MKNGDITEAQAKVILQNALSTRIEINKVKEDVGRWIGESHVDRIGQLVSSASEGDVDLKKEISFVLQDVWGISGDSPPLAAVTNAQLEKMVALAKSHAAGRVQEKKSKPGVRGLQPPGSSGIPPKSERTQSISEIADTLRRQIRGA